MPRITIGENVVRFDTDGGINVGCRYVPYKVIQDIYKQSKANYKEKGKFKAGDIVQVLSLGPGDNFNIERFNERLYEITQVSTGDGYWLLTNIVTGDRFNIVSGAQFEKFNRGDLNA